MNMQQEKRIVYREDSFVLRLVNENDLDLLLTWANDQEVRRNSFQQKQITYEEHCAWFKRAMEDADQRLYLLEKDGSPIGQIRLGIEGDSAEISYSIANGERGRGYGKELIRLLKEAVRREEPGIRKLTAKTKPGNDASIKCFTGNGFEEEYRQYALKL